MMAGFCSLDLGPRKYVHACMFRIDVQNVMR